MKTGLGCLHLVLSSDMHSYRGPTITHTACSVQNACIAIASKHRSNALDAACLALCTYTTYTVVAPNAPFAGANSQASDHLPMLIAIA
jgi:hypothetical protein